MLCSITDGDLPMGLTWYRDEARILNGGKSFSGVTITGIGRYESVLRIDKLRPGEYRELKRDELQQLKKKYLNPYRRARGVAKGG